jgi:hypothetical protein
MSPGRARMVSESHCQDALVHSRGYERRRVVTLPCYGLGFRGERWDGRGIRETAGGGTSHLARPLRTSVVPRLDAACPQAWRHGRI